MKANPNLPWTMPDATLWVDKPELLGLQPGSRVDLHRCNKVRRAVKVGQLVGYLPAKVRSVLHQKISLGRVVSATREGLVLDRGRKIRLAWQDIGSFYRAGKVFVPVPEAVLEA
jgi:hypothetical protein